MEPTFGDRVRSLRKQRGEGQAQTAIACGITRQLLHSYETNRITHPTAPQIRKFARHFNVSADFLLGLVNSG